MASDQNKPNGMFVIPLGRGEAFVAGLPVKKFHGIGPATAAKLNALGIETGADLKTKSLAFLDEHFGKAGESYYWIARGVDNRPVRPNRVRKAIGAENTFERDLTALADLRAELVPIVRKVWDHCEAHGTRGRTVTLKVKYADFERITRSRSSVSVVASWEELQSIAQTLLHGTLPARIGIRLLGVTLSGLNQGEPDEEMQMPLAL